MKNVILSKRKEFNEKNALLKAVSSAVADKAFAAALKNGEVTVEGTPVVRAVRPIP